MEESTINDLYMKYTNEVEGALEEDRYFQYLFEMIQAGDNTLEQKNRVLHKVVDERWLTVVEEGIESIFNIVDKPRRFIATSEEVVPVALAKKITADSVRHLSQNTQFIASNEAGEIQPTRILNVTTEESYDLYENRFVYHLIQRLFAFVDKRTDIIFWSTGDETCNVMSMESKIDDAYEEISYKVEMTIKNRQSYVENDTDNMDLFKRIDRVRRMSRTLRASSFCDIMNGCAKVRSPIQRTNLMMKDPDYRACYKLWQFIEGYDEVGYTIEEQDSALQFDEEYLLQMYINMITNYTVFKSLLESDPRKMSELATEKREPVKPKFIKKIEEQIVEDRNIEDVEIRKVFVEEVTQAQLDAEAKLEDETRRREELEQSMQSLEWQLDSTMQDLQFLEQMKEELENQKAEIEAQLEIEQKAQAELKEAMERAEIEAKNEIEVIRSETTETIEAERREKEETIEKIQSEAQAKVQQFSQEKEKAYKEVEKSLRQVEAAKKESKQYQAEAAETRLSAEQTIKETNEAAKKTVEEVQRNAEEAILKAQKEAEEAVKTARREAEEAVRRAQKEAERAVQKAQEEAEQSVKAAKEEADKTVQSVKADAEETVKQVKQEAEKEVETAKKKQLQAEKEKEKAVAKSEANSLSRYILNALQERKERKNSKEDDNNQ
ncbi:hypothetical protein [Blautia stercoris]